MNASAARYDAGSENKFGKTSSDANPTKPTGKYPNVFNETLSRSPNYSKLQFLRNERYQGLAGEKNLDSLIFSSQTRARDPRRPKRIVDKERGVNVLFRRRGESDRDPSRRSPKSNSASSCTKRRTKAGSIDAGD